MGRAEDRSGRTEGFRSACAVRRWLPKHGDWTKRSGAQRPEGSRREARDAQRADRRAACQAGVSRACAEDRRRESSFPGPVAGSPHAVLGALSHLAVLIAPAARRGDAPPGATRRKGLLDSHERVFGPPTQNLAVLE